MSSNSDNRFDVVILGAGPAGVSAGCKLTKNGKNVAFIEKNDCIGGLARTLRYKDILLDIGPHILCSREYIYDYYPNICSWIQSLLGSELDNYETLNKLYRESVCAGGKKYKYPISLFNALINVGFVGSMKIGMDYLKTLVFKKEPGDTYESCLNAYIGKELASLFLYDINKKQWNIPPDRISRDVLFRVRSFSLFDIIKKQMKNFIKVINGKGTPIIYPKQGIGVICNRLKQEIDKSNTASWLMSSIPSEITIENNKIVSISVVKADGVLSTKIIPKQVISSIPLYDLLSVITPRPPNNVLAAVSKLRFRSHVCVYLVFEAKKILEEHCIYFADLEIPFARMMELNHYSDALVPNGKVVLGVEYFCWAGDECWNMKDSDLSNKTVIWLKKLNLFPHNEKLIDSFVHREKDAYPVYELKYAENLQKVKDYLHTITNLQIIGRIGSFNYCGQYKAMQMGINCASHILNETNGR